MNLMYLAISRAAAQLTMALNIVREVNKASELNEVCTPTAIITAN